MSNAFYPLGLIEDLKVERIDRTVIDTFEDGSSSANSIWGEKMFKRRFTVRHAPLSQAEFRYLRDFFVARSGRHDPFWFRDNVHRGGSSFVRLAQPVPERRGASGYYTGMELVLEQTAPVRELVGVDEVYEVLADGGFTSATLLAWWDANRTIYYRHAGTVYQEAVIPDMSGNGYHVQGVGGTAPPLLSAQIQNQAFLMNNTSYATGTAAGVTGPALVAQPIFSIFLLFMVNTGTYTGPKVLAAVGGGFSGQGTLGIQIEGSEIKPYVGASEVWTGAPFTEYAMHSACVVWTAGSNAATTYVDGVATAAGSNTRSYLQNAFTFGATLNGSKIDFSGTGLYVPQVLFIHNGAPDAATVKALHNLFVHQYSAYGLATVA